MNKIKLYRSFLFVPGNRPDRYVKALSSGADAVIIDLEDAVAVDAKPQARVALNDFAHANTNTEFWVRINAADTGYFADDIKLCAGLPNLAGVILPKAESAEQIRSLGVISKPIIPLIESPVGVLAIPEIAKVKSVQRLCFGALDLMLEMGVTPDTTAADILLNDIRCRLLLNSQAYGLGKPIDTVFPNIKDESGLEKFAIKTKDLGFAGMLCIHPKQVAIVHKAFAPGQEQLDWAQKIVEHADATGSMAFSMDGQMVDQPVITRAKALLASRY